MTRRRALWLLALVTVVLLGVLAALDGRMQDAGGPGIVAFELAGSSARATEIMADWGQQGHDAALWSLWLDFPFLLAYGAFFALAVLALRDAAERRGWSRYAAPGAAIAVLPLAAAAFDAIEDVNLLLVVGGHGGSIAPPLATGFAIAKFACLTVTQLYLLAGLIALAVTRLRRSGASQQEQ